MAEERVERRLAAILVADVVGYSGLIRADEEGTRAAVRQLMTETVERQAVAHSGLALGREIPVGQLAQLYLLSHVDGHQILPDFQPASVGVSCGLDYVVQQIATKL